MSDEQPYAYTIPRKTADGVDLCITDGVPLFWERHGEDVTIITWGDDGE